MLLKSKNLCLKPLSLDELNGPYVSWLNDKEVCQYNSHGDTIYTQEMAMRYIRSLENNPHCEVYAVYYDKTHIGNISLQNINFKNNNAEIALLFGEKKFWGMGYATEASQIIIKRAFEELKLHRLYFGTHIENIGMQKVGEKLGFQKEGVFKDAQYKNGKYNDTIQYALINADLYRGGGAAM